MKVFANQISDPKFWNGKTRPAHLEQLGYTRVQTSKIIQKLVNIDIGDNNFVNYVNTLSVRENPEEGTYRWAMQGIEERNYPLVKATIDAAGTTAITDNHRAGYKGGTFYMWFDNNYFFATETITSNHPEIFMLRITGDGVPVGTMYRYEVQLMATAQSELFVPASELEVGSRWVYRYGIVESDESVRGSGVRHGTHFELENSSSTLRKNYEVPGSMIDKGKNNPLEWTFVTDEGKTFTSWLPKLDYDFHVQFERDKANLMLYGKATTIGGIPSMIKGESGNSVKAGMGLYEFMNTGNVKYYNDFNIDNLAKFILDITYNTVGRSQRDIVVTTGEYGLYQAHKALMAKGATYSWGSSDHNFRKNSDGTVTLDEGQMIEYVWINGIKIKFMLDKMKDNTISNTLQHPEGGPVTSYIYDIFDFGMTDDTPNIQRLKVGSYEELYGYIPGMRDPFNPYDNLSSPRLMATSKDGYAVFKQWAGGLHMNNPKKTGRYLPSMYRA